jgi:hypothetical protein
MSDGPKLTAIKPEPHGQGCIALLEKALEEARAGRYSAIALAVVYRDGSPGAKWSLPFGVASLIGAVSRLAHKLNQEADE